MLTQFCGCNTKIKNMTYCTLQVMYNNRNFASSFQQFLQPSFREHLMKNQLKSYRIRSMIYSVQTFCCCCNLLLVQPAIIPTWFLIERFKALIETATINQLMSLYSTSKCSRWPRSLRRRSAVARLLGLRVRILPGTWMSFACECYVLSSTGLCVGLITRLEEF